MLQDLELNSLISKIVSEEGIQNKKEDVNKDYILIGNGLKKLKRISEFKFVKKKSLSLYDLKSNYFINNYFKKKSTYSFPKIIYPYSPV
jgi:hypothetical protein